MAGKLLKRIGSTFSKALGSGSEGERFRFGSYTPSVSFAKPSSFKTGGVVQKSGLAMVHKGERVIPKRMKKASSRKRY